MCSKHFPNKIPLFLNHHASSYSVSSNRFYSKLHELLQAGCSWLQRFHDSCQHFHSFALSDGVFFEAALASALFSVQKTHGDGHQWQKERNLSSEGALTSRSRIRQCLPMVNQVIAKSQLFNFAQLHYSQPEPFHLICYGATTSLWSENCFHGAAASVSPLFLGFPWLRRVKWNFNFSSVALFPLRWHSVDVMAMEQWDSMANKRNANEWTWN